MVKLSDRMRAVAACVTPGLAVADIGCDHGYLPIFLVEENIVPSAVAMDIKEGPLKAARENIHREGLDEKIKTRKSDGLKELLPGEAQSIIIAGMGGRLALKILQDATGFMERTGDIREVIVQPQSELSFFRRSMKEMGYICAQEDIVFEDGKFYPMGRYIPAYISRQSEGGWETISDSREQEHGMTGQRQTLLAEHRELEEEYGAWLLVNRHPVLHQYLEKECKQLCQIRQSLSEMQDGEAKNRRLKEVEAKLQQNQLAESFFD